MTIDAVGETVSAPKEPEEKDSSSQFFKRTFVAKDKTPYEFNFLVIDSAEKWQPAEGITGSYDMPLLGRDKSIRFQLRGLSLAEMEGVEIEHKIPRWNEKDGPETEEFKLSKELAQARKRARMIELSSGKLIPGENYDQKARALQSLNPGEVSALFYYIQNFICSLDNGNLFGQYQRIVAEAADTVQDRIVTFDSFDVWKKATETPYIFRMQRPTDDYILEFPLKNISAEVKLQIDAETREPEPPRMPKRGPDKRPIPNETVPDFNDQGWLARVRAVNQKRTVMFFTACLSFDIPGSNEKEKYEWLSKRLVGDVIRLRNFIEEELCEYQSRFNFFLNV